MRRFIRRCNDMIAARLLLAMSTIWCVYLFIAWSILPILSERLDAIVFWSSIVIQLAALPLIMLAIKTVGETIERRAAQDYGVLMSEMRLGRVVDLSGLETRLTAIEQRIGKLRAAPPRKPRVKKPILRRSP